MKLTADQKGSLTSTELFRPGAVFDATREADGSIRVVELVKSEIPLVQPVRTKEGFLMSPVRLKREAIRRAIRIDRDAR
jgi:hypothetical protein